MREAVDFITEDIWGCFDTDDNATERFVYANNNFHKNSITNRLKGYFNDVIKAAKNQDESYENDFADTHFEVLTVCAVKDLQTFEPEWKEKQVPTIGETSTVKCLTAPLCGNICTYILKMGQFSSTRTSNTKKLTN